MFLGSICKGKCCEALKTDGVFKVYGRLLVATFAVATLTRAHKLATLMALCNDAFQKLTSLRSNPTAGKDVGDGHTDGDAEDSQRGVHEEVGGRGEFAHMALQTH